MADASQNKPMKELVYALVGTVLFLAIIALIAVAAWLRPAGEHIVDNAVEMPVETKEDAAEQALGDITTMEEAATNESEDASAEQAQVADSEQAEANDAAPTEAQAESSTEDTTSSDATEGGEAAAEASTDEATAEAADTEDSTTQTQ